MPDTYLTLGGYTFQGFGVPERINGGGAHKLVVHKFLGGDRVIDAMGADDDVICWRGRFFNSDGIDAVADALLMDAMRRAGKPVTLTYDNQTIQVVIRSFTWDFERFYNVPYKLECEVLSNQAQASGGDSSGDGSGATDQTQDGAVGGDMSNATDAADGSTETSDAVQGASDSYDENGPLANAATDAVQAVSDAVTTATDTLNSLADAANTVLTPINDIIGGVTDTVNSVIDAAQGAANLVANAATMTIGASAQITLPFMQRISLNLSLGAGSKTGA
jgi:hypothetical protein